MRGFARGVRAAPVGENKSLEVVGLLENIGEQVAVFAGKVPVHAVVRTHESARIGNPESDLKGTQIGFPHRTFVDVGVDGVAPALLVIHSIVLQVADDVLGLHALDEVTHKRAGQQRIFALVLECAAVTRLTRKVDASTKRHAIALGPQLAANQRPIFKGSLRVPCRGGRQIVRQRGGIAP